jgi:hypothetical protein
LPVNLGRLGLELLQGGGIAARVSLRSNSSINLGLRALFRVILRLDCGDCCLELLAGEDRLFRRLIRLRKRRNGAQGAVCALAFNAA